MIAVTRLTALILCLGTGIGGVMVGWAVCQASHRRQRPAESAPERPLYDHSPEPDFEALGLERPRIVRRKA